MRVLLFGASGMVGEGVLRWLLQDASIAEVVSVGRSPIAVTHPKLRSVVEPDLFHLSDPSTLANFDACFFCLGVSSVGMSESTYRRVTQDLTLAIAHQLLPQNPQMVFEYISGDGTKANSGQMWARVKAETEQKLLATGFRDAYMLRPGFIQPMRGVTSRIKWMRWLYAACAPLYPLLQRVMPGVVTSTDRLAAAMVQLARKGWGVDILSPSEINQVFRETVQHS